MILFLEILILITINDKKAQRKQVYFQININRILFNEIIM